MLMSGLTCLTYCETSIDLTVPKEQANLQKHQSGGKIHCPRRSTCRPDRLEAGACSCISFSNQHTGHQQLCGVTAKASYQQQSQTLCRPYGLSICHLVPTLILLQDLFVCSESVNLCLSTELRALHQLTCRAWNGYAWGQQLYPFNSSETDSSSLPALQHLT